MRQIFKYVSVAVAASVVGTLAGVVVYPILVFHQSPDLTSLWGIWFWGRGPAVRSLVFAVPAGLALFVLSRWLGNLSFLLLCAGVGVLLGIVFGFWLVQNSPHISRLAAAEILGVTWGSTAFLGALLRHRSP
jgi:hypothetical protein